MQAADYHTQPDPRAQPQKPPVSALLTNLAEHSAALIKSEWQLLVLEMQEKANDYRATALLLGVGAAIIFMGLMAYSVAIVNILASYIGLTPSATIYGSVLLLLGMMIIYRATKE